MKTQKLKKFVIVLLTSFAMVSCFKNDDDVNLEVYNDVYMIKKLDGDQPVYGIAFYAYGNQIMKSGTVTQVGGLGETINLGLSPVSIFTLTKEPTGSDFKTNVPAASEYNFSVTAESGAMAVSSDFLNVKNIDIPEIIKTEIGANQKLVDVGWTPVSGVDGYVLKIKDENENYIYSSGGMESNITTYTINFLSGNWTTPIESGKTYSIEVHAFAYEEDADELYAAYNVEEISIGSKSIVIP